MATGSRFKLKTPNFLKTAWHNVSHLLYPDLCLICERETLAEWRGVCVFCKKDLHFTQHEYYDEESPLDKLFWGRVSVHATYSLLHFQKEKSTQQILHAIKYKHRRDLAVLMGEMIGERLTQADFADLDALIPVPLHPKKQYIRGYNQSEKTAQGIDISTGIKTDTQFLIRNAFSESQTTKSRFLRWDNVEEKFSLHKNASGEYKHIALIDDVVTTGATLESIIRIIQKAYPEIKISIIALALTK